jgi:SAM-dependent methyltransferase
MPDRDERASETERAFEAIYAGAGDDLQRIPWARLAPNPALLAWLAIARCRERFPDSAVEYLVADVYSLPADWRRAFELIVEIRTLQSLPPGARQEAARSIGETLAPGGELFVLAYGRHDHWRPQSRPWPVTRGELAAFAAVGLNEASFSEEPLNDHGDLTFQITYRRV